MRALISVSDKSGIVDLAKELIDLGIEIISTGGTYKLLKEKGLEVKEVSSITSFPECLDGRVKTLHPNIHAGILAIRDNKEHQAQMKKMQIEYLDLIIVNLYPFKEVITKNDVDFENAVENIDIGGPTMLRAGAKNFQDVIVLTDPNDYKLVIEELKETKKVSYATRLYLMQKVFEHTAAYDALIFSYLKKERKDYSFPDKLTLTFDKRQTMRYGENPHQQAAFYQEITDIKGTLSNAIQLHGKELSFNNINDTNGALELLKEFDEPTVVACKHGNPCGVGSGKNIDEAWEKAFQADKVSIFGGIVVFNQEVTLKIAKELNNIFIEVVVAPSYDEQALTILKGKKNIRLLQLDDITKLPSPYALDLKKVNGGLIVQNIDSQLFNEDELEYVTILKPTKEQMEDLKFAMKVVKFVKSNGIAIAKNKMTLGIGPGQVNRIWATKQSIEHAIELSGDEHITSGAVLASDAFFPFADCVEEAIQAGIKAIIQPGGSIKDQDSINKCNEYGIAMVFTKMRHFKH